MNPAVNKVSNNGTPMVQSKRPTLSRHNTGASQLGDHTNINNTNSTNNTNNTNTNKSNTSAAATTSQLHQRIAPKNPRHGQAAHPNTHHAHHAHHVLPQFAVGGGGSSSRLHARVPSSKKLNRRQQSSSSPDRPVALAHLLQQHQQHLQLQQQQQQQQQQQHNKHHRRATSEGIKLPRQSSSSAAAVLKKNSSHSSLGLAGKRNRSQLEINKRTSKSSTNLNQSPSHKDLHKLKGARSQVHFDLGDDIDGLDDDTHEDEWVDASNSASPYLSRRGSIVSPGQSSSTKEDSRGRDDNDDDENESGGSHPSRPYTPTKHHQPPVDPATVQHREYITSRLLGRVPSSGAPPKMSSETASVRPNPSSPGSRRGPPSLYGTPKNTTLVGSGGDELTSRFVNGSGPSAEPGSFCTPTRSPTHASDSMRRPRSMGNLEQEHQNALSDDEGDSALAPRTRRSVYRAQPAEKSRTQQKLNLQRASSSIEPAQAGGAAGVSGVSPLVGGSSYDNRDPRIGKLLERTGMEYLVVRRYQNPIARSISRLSRMPVNQKHRRIPQQNGANGTGHNSRPSDLGGPGNYNLSQSYGDYRSRPTTPRRSTSIRTNGAGSSFDAQDERAHDHLSGASFVNGDDDGVSALLRNLWDKSPMEFSASQD